MSKFHKRLLIIASFIYLLGSLLFYSSLISAFIITKAKMTRPRFEENWLIFEYPIWFYFSILLILINCFLTNMVFVNAKKNKFEIVNKYLLIKGIVIATFTLFIIMSWYSLINNGIYFTGYASNVSGSFYFTISLLYLLDILISLIPILIIRKRIKKHRISNSKIEFYAISILFNYLTFIYIYIAFVFLM